MSTPTIHPLRILRFWPYIWSMSESPTIRRTVLPPADLDPVLDLSRFLDHLTEPAALLGPDGQTVPLPIEAFDVLIEVARAMRLGKAITVAPVDQLLTTQEAADFLGISRPTLIKLLESDEIPYTRPGAGRHRRIRLEDVLTYHANVRSRRRETLDELTREAAAAGLYDDDIPDYGAALKQARRARSRT